MLEQKLNKKESDEGTDEESIGEEPTEQSVTPAAPVKKAPQPKPLPKKKPGTTPAALTNDDRKYKRTAR